MLAQPQLVGATQRFALFLRGQRLLAKACQGFVKLCVEIEIRVRGVHVREQAMAGGAREFSFIRRSAKMFNDLRLGHLEIVVAHKRGDTGGDTHRGRIVAGNRNVEAAGEAGFQKNSGNYLRGRSGGRRFALRYRGTGLRAAKSAARVSAFTF